VADKPALERIDEILALLSAPAVSFATSRASFSQLDERDWWCKQLGKPIEAAEPEPALH
jgi:hypothetical protein